MQSTTETSHNNDLPSNLDGSSTSRLRDPPSAEYRDLELGSASTEPVQSPLHHETDRADDDYDLSGQIWARRNPPWSWSRRGLVAWCKGPDPPRIHRIKPWFAKWQAAPADLVERCLPRRRMKIAVLLGGILSWLVIFLVWLKSSDVNLEVPGYGQPIKMSCHQRLWSNATDCGLDGEACLPFEGQPFAFRCPSGCAAAILLEPYTVGEREYNYRPLVIGGKPPTSDSGTGVYRGDSSVCASALHAGLISNAKGGWGILHRTGERDRFGSTTQHGIESIPFMPHFPFSFTFQAPSEGSGENEPIEISDIRWPLFAFTLTVTAILSVTVTSASVFYSVVYFMVWFQVAMASDPPTSDFYDRVSIFTSRFVPGAFVGFVLYHFWVKRTLRKLDAHVDKTVLWLGGCWLGALNTDTFDRLPISRLTPHDIQQQPGAVTALLVIVSFLITVTFLQAYGFRQEGRFVPMLRLYVLLVLGIVLLAFVPYMKLRIHHDLLALLLIPGTSMQTRPSLLFQGILLGLYINGIARWGFGAILQTPASMLDGGKLYTPPPVLTPPHVEHRNRLLFKFGNLPDRVDGISVLVNDVLRYEGLKSNGSQDVGDFAWSRRFDNETEYFRFGYAHARALGGFWYEDFTDPATWAENGSFSLPTIEMTL